MKTDAARAATVLYVSLRAVDSLKTIFTPFLPHTSQQLHELLGYDGMLAGPVEFREVEDDGETHEILTGDYTGWVGTLGAEQPPARAAAARTEAALPQARRVDRRRGAGADARRRRRVIDSHAHLGADAADVLERAAAAGVTRVVAVATTVAGARDALALADQHDGVLRVPRRAPARGGRARRPRASCARCSIIRRPSPWGRPGLDYFRDYAPHDAQQRLFDQQLALALEVDKPVVIHTRAADDDTRARLVDHDGTVILHCFSSPPLLDDCARQRLVRVVRRQRHLQERLRPARLRAPRSRPTACSSRPTARTSRRRPFADAGTSRRSSSTPTTSSPSCAARTCARSPTRTRRGRSGSHEDRRAQGPRPALPGRREHPPA